MSQNILSLFRSHTPIYYFISPQLTFPIVGTAILEYKGHMETDRFCPISFVTEKNIINFHNLDQEKCFLYPILPYIRASDIRGVPYFVYV